jgi:Na+/proline symporter
VRAARLFTIAWSLVAIGAGHLAWRLGSVLEVIVKVNSYFYGCLLGLFLLGMFTVRATGAGARAGVLLSMAFIILLSWRQPAWWPWFGAAGCLVSVAVGYAASPSLPRRQHASQHV